MRRTLTLAALVCAGGAPLALASFHLMRIDEIYSSPDGRVQFIELRATANNQTQLSNTRIVAFDPTGAVETLVIDITANFPALNSQETWLVATPCFENAAGFAPDYVIPAAGLIPGPDGRVVFRNDAGTNIVESVAYGAYTGSNGAFGTPAAALPMDGQNALRRVSTTNPHNNSVNFATGANSPKRNDGTTAVLDLRPCAGDTNFDRTIDFADINNVLSEFNQSGPCLRGDLDGSGTGNFGDLNIVLGNYNTSC
ncbi:MAG: hypothetical protein IBJ10_05645 [Phycisphaerales bacterium]|nr:hypothetical protein [Phycisphaerales bacterium]